MITIFPTRILIDDYIHCDKLEKSLSVWDPIYFTYSFRAFTYDEDEGMIVIPGGYDIKTLRVLFPNMEIRDLRDEYNKVIYQNRPIRMLYQPRDKGQEEAIQFLKGNRFSQRDTQKMLSLNTGEGKTYCAINYIVSTKRRPVIFVDQDSLCKQWKERILEFTDTSEDEIFIISGKDSIKKLEKMKEEEILHFKFFLCIYRTITTMLNNEEDERVIDLFEKLKLSVKIFDEAHVEMYAIFQLDCYIDCQSVYLTATPKRSDPIEDRIYQRMFANVKRFTSESIKGKNNEKYHNIIIYKINTKPSDIDKANMMTKYGFSATKHADYLMNNKYEYFYDILYNIVFNTMLKKGTKHKKIAILLSLNSFVDKIYNDFKQEIISNKFDYTIGKFNGTIDKNKKMDELSKDIIITTDKSFSKGMDVKDLECLINTVPLGSPTITEQIIGRLRKIPNKKVFYFDVTDIGFPNVKGQLYHKNKVFEKKACDIIEVNK